MYFVIRTTGHPQFSGIIQNIENCCAIRAKIWKFDFLLYKIDYFDNNQHRRTRVKMAQGFSIFWITPLNCGWQNTWLVKFSSGGTTLYKNPSDQTVHTYVHLFVSMTTQKWLAANHLYYLFIDKQIVGNFFGHTITTT